MSFINYIVKIVTKHCNLFRSQPAPERLSMLQLSQFTSGPDAAQLAARPWLETWQPTLH